MSEVLCLECDRKIKLRPNAKVGDSLVCSNCDAEFELVGVDPPKIAWLYDEYDDYNDDDDDDDLDDDSWDDDDWDDDDQNDEKW